MKFLKEVNSRVKICMITTHILPNKKPVADLLRFLNLRSELKFRGNSIITISRNTRLRLDVIEKNDFIEYKVPSVDIRWIRKILFIVFLIPALTKVCKSKKPEIIFSNSVMCAPASLIAHLLFNGEIRIQYDVMGIAYREALLNPSSKLYGISQALLYNFLDKLMLKSADFITTVNEAHKKIIERGTSKQVYVVRDAINPEQFKKIEIPQLKKDKDEIFIMFVGSISRNRIEPLVNSFPKIHEENPSAKLIIIGDGSDKAYYEKRAEDLNLFDTGIVFTGYIPNDKIPSYLALADICYSDVWSKIGFPMKVFEYMAMGKAMVGEDNEATREILINSKNAFLYNGEKDLFEKIMLLVRDKELRERLGKNAKEMVLKEHTWKKRGKQLMEIYNEIN